VSISGDYKIVGAEKDHADGAESGSAYVFHRAGATWSQEAKLTAGLDGAAFDHLGVSVSISGDYAIVGAFEDDDPIAGLVSGSAYVFHRSGTTWTKHAKLTASDAAAGDHFGISVSISGDYVIVGAKGDDDPPDSGAAYVFKREGTSWTQQAKVKPSDADPQGDKFGWSVSISGDRAIVGAVLADDPNYGGAAYVFHRSGTTWTEQAKISASDSAVSDAFGNSVSIWGSHALVGADFDDGQTGSAYAFAGSGTSWNQTVKVTASDAAATDFFGESVSISGDYAIVGAWGDDSDGSVSGAAYIYHSEEDLNLCPSLLSSETTRLGTPPNPNAFLPGVTSGPIIGATWDPVVDHSSFHTGAVLDILAIDLTGPINITTPWGTLLVGISPMPIVVSNPAGVPFGVGIPHDCGLVGALAYTQVAAWAPGTNLLTNALDLVIGTY